MDCLGFNSKIKYRHCAALHSGCCSFRKTKAGMKRSVMTDLLGMKRSVMTDLLGMKLYGKSPVLCFRAVHRARGVSQGRSD